MTICVVLLTILILVLALLLSSMVFWGLGIFVCYVFAINYTWTFLHGVICAVVFSLLKEIFGGKQQ